MKTKPVTNGETLSREGSVMSIAGETGKVGVPNKEPQLQRKRKVCLRKYASDLWPHWAHTSAWHLESVQGIVVVMRTLP